MALIDMMETFQMTNPGEHIDATDVYNSNDNLLDNAYFVGGGSQLGDGIFPINQRGQTSYSVAYENIFDRWHIQGSAVSTCTLNANGITFTANTENCGLSQTTQRGKIEDGENYTLSVITTDGVLHYGTRVLNTNDSWQNFSLGLESMGFYNPCYINSNGQANVFIADKAGSGGTSISIAAAKLEKGTVSTLPNDMPPDFWDELRKCRSYLFRHTYSAYDIIGNGYALSTTVGGFLVNLPASMNTDSTIQATFTANPSAYGGGVGSNITNAYIATLKDASARFYFEHQGIPANNAVCIMATAETTLTISCEL